MFSEFVMKPDPLPKPRLLQGRVISGHGFVPPPKLMTRRLISRLILPAAAFVLGAGIPSAQASTIFWNNDGDTVLLDSSGNALTSDYQFEIGVFADGFMPTASNLDDWAANWRVMDRSFDATPEDTADPDAEGWDSALGAFTGTVEQIAGGTTDSPEVTPGYQFVQGTVMYIWVYNTRDRSNGTAEWALVTDGTDVGDDLNGNDWIVPDPTDTGGVNILLRDADTAVFGSVNGAGVSLQTSLVPVPEPGSALLAGLAAVGALLARRRRITPA